MALFHFQTQCHVITCNRIFGQRLSVNIAETKFSILTYVCVKLYNVIPTHTVPSINKRNKMLFSFKQDSTSAVMSATEGVVAFRTLIFWAVSSSV